MSIIKDGDFILVKIPDRDIQSMVRYIAHAVVLQENNALKLCHQIVTGDITRQDEYVEDLSNLLEVSNYQIVLNGAEALELCDNLADTIYDEKLKIETEPARICSYCHRCYIGEKNSCECPESKRAQMRLVK